MTDTVYSGEALLRNWSESASGKRRIILEIEDNGGAHPFKGFEGERFMIAVAGPVQNDGTVSPETGKAAGGVYPDGASAASGLPAATKRTASQRAALLLQRDGFDEFARAHPSFDDSFETAEGWLLAVCGVFRKREINDDNATFHSIEGNFRAWQQARGHSREAS